MGLALKLGMATMAELTSQVCWLKAWLTEMAASGKHIQSQWGCAWKTNSKLMGRACGEDIESSWSCT